MSAVVEKIRTAVSTVHDPEYPGVSVTDLGLVENIELQGDRASISMIPTYGGCPALGFIADDVKEAVEALDGVSTCEVRWLRSPVWTQDRVSAEVIRVLEQEFTVTLRRRDGSLVCPVCGSGTVRDTAPMGPSRCRSLAFCDDCRNPIEVMR